MSEIGERTCTPLINIPISFVGISWFELTNKFWFNGIFLNILSASNILLACFWRTNLWTSVVEVVGPIWTVLAEPICANELNILIFVISWPGWGKTGSTKYVLPVSNPINPSPSGWYTISSPWMNFTFLERGKFIKLNLSLRLLYPSKPAAVPPTKVSSIIFEVIS